jgi:hypothetical protein
LALVYVMTFGKNLPFQDEWHMVVPFLTGERALTLEHLWAQHNEHRIVLTKLVELCLIRLGGGDFRVSMYVNVALCAATAAALVLAARQLRGRSAYQDAVFPLLLLQVGHYETLPRGDQVGNVLGTALACTVLLIMLQGRGAIAPRRPGRGMPAATALLWRRWPLPRPRPVRVACLRRRGGSPGRLPTRQDVRPDQVDDSIFFNNYYIFIFS